MPKAGKRRLIDQLLGCLGFRDIDRLICISQERLSARITHWPRLVRLTLPASAYLIFSVYSLGYMREF
jgi:hypothetical protein